MENLIIYPETKKQLDILKALLEEMKIRFKSGDQEKIKVKISKVAEESIRRGLIDAEIGNFVSEEEAEQFLDDVFN
ncbi:DUF2683 family protein [Chryseobacterium sp. MP_3.2]|uniref:DUF2683 family protein n=1 Tax=Chryseobacterium sp. MP_3.2 TaxID=3071712 RepID=UPI002E08B24B|nr:putative transcriptional regulator [Chryseobacterium sp. MP_3.2]